MNQPSAEILRLAQENGWIGCRFLYREANGFTARFRTLETITWEEATKLDWMPLFDKTEPVEGAVSAWERQRTCKHEYYDPMCDWCHDCQSVLNPSDGYKNGYDCGFKDSSQQLKGTVARLTGELDYMVKANKLEEKTIDRLQAEVDRLKGERNIDTIPSWNLSSNTTKKPKAVGCGKWSLLRDGEKSGWGTCGEVVICPDCQAKAKPEMQVIDGWSKDELEAVLKVQAVTAASNPIKSVLPDSLLKPHPSINGQKLLLPKSAADFLRLNGTDIDLSFVVSKNDVYLSEFIQYCLSIDKHWGLSDD